MEKDLGDKFAALQIDEQSAELRNDSAGLHFVPGAARISAKYAYHHSFIFVLALTGDTTSSVD